MHIKQKKGFTLAEIVATLVILGVILVIAVPGIGKLYQKFAENYYKELDETVLQAAKLYFKDTEDSRPQELLQYKSININNGSNSLVGKKYIEKAKLFNSDKDCTGEVRILKVKDDYIYKNCMICESEGGDTEYHTYENLKAVEYDGSGNIKPIPSDNICYLNDVIEKEYLDDDLFIYMNEYDENSLKQALEIREKASISKDGEKIYEIETGNKIYPQNITAIDLGGETISSNLNVGIQVKYSDSISRNVYVYKYKKPELTNSATGNVISSPINSNSDLKLYPNSGTFKINNSNKTYPYVNTGVEAIGNPIDFSPDDRKDFSHYEYSSDGTNWNKLCENNMDCIFNASTLSLSSQKVKFRTVGKDVEGNKYYGEETYYYNVIPIYTVTFNPDGGTVSYTSKQVYFGQEYGSLPEATNGAREFKGWYTDTGIKVESTSIVQIEGNHTLTAKWGPQTYIVTLNPNGGSVSPTTINVLAGEKYGTLPTPTRSNYVFTGWYTAASGGTLVESTTTVTNASNHMLYAQWYSSDVQTVTTTTCQTKNLPEGVYYIEIVGGGAGGNGYGEWSEWKNYVGGNAARWAGYIYMPKINNAKVCAGAGSVGKRGFSTVSNGGDSYIANSAGTRLIEVNGGKSRANKPYTNALVSVSSSNAKLVCNSVAGKTSVGNEVKYGYGGKKVSMFGRYDNATDGTSGIIKYQYIKSLDEWNNSPKTCPATPLCSISDCGWVNWP